MKDHRHNMAVVAGATDLGAVLRRRGEAHPERLAYGFLRDGRTVHDSLTYGQLDRRARALAARLQESLAPQERAVLLYPPGLDFTVAFFACLYAGVIAVPAYPPRPNRADRRILGLVADCRPAVFLTVEAIAPLLEPLAAACGEAAPAIVATDTVGQEGAESFREDNLDPEAIAFLQYTSGSTAAPKGVLVSHANIMANEEAIRLAMEHDDSVVGLAWLPVFHDMGLLGNTLQPIYVGGRSYLIPPLTFLKRPLCWPEAVSTYGGTSSGGPNFAFDLCAAAAAQGLPEGLDLSSWSLAYVGAEPIRPATLTRFAKAFGGHGFDKKAFFPCYGMAECTLIATGGPKGADPVTPRVDGGALAAGRAEFRRWPGGQARRIAGCGQVVPGHQVGIVNPDTGARLPDGQVGEVWFQGPSVARGYYGNTRATAETFGAFTQDGQGPWLRTGDLGFLGDGELYITGRIKDLLIVRGRNYYPSDLEISAEQAHPAVQPNGCAAFAAGEDEAVVVALELKRLFYQQARNREDSDLTATFGELAAAVREQVSGEHELTVNRVLVLKPGGIPRTSSGKIRRSRCRQLDAAGKLEALAVL